MIKKKDKEIKIGSFKKKEEKPKKSIWDYKPYLIVGAVVIVAAIVYLLVLRNLEKNPVVTEAQPTVIASPSPKLDCGTLVVETDPPGAFAQLMDKYGRTPITFKDLPEGTYQVILRFIDQKPMIKTVEVKKNQINTLKVKLDE
ncbi:MAG: PEGA domain-containing protein [Candidatus Eremiobacteraeota bacterium]|nr:PEGA domain-containing protein [Candidatus Eremiobacteraeota bacterium]